MMRVFISTLMASTLLFSPVRTTHAAEGEYRLSAQDRVRIKVTEWRGGRGEAYEWEAFTGEYLVDPSGQLSLPLIGEIDAGGLTTSEVARLIGERLKARVGLVERPDASVEIAQFRPIYVVGHVDKPGAYPYRPQLTVLQAVSLAGGFYRPPESGFQRLARESITAQGELRDVAAERTALMARRARLEAEMRGADVITFPAIFENQRGVQVAEDAVREERVLFDSRRNALRSQVEALTQTKAMIASEIETLQAKTVSQERQLTLAQKELEGINSLMQRGLAVNPRLLAVEQTVAQMEGARLDNVLAVSRARQDISRTERTIIDLKTQRQNTVLAELRETQIRLVRLEEKSDTLRSLIVDSEIVAPKALLAQQAGERRAPSYVMVRPGPGGAREITARESDLVQPGDVLKVDGPGSRSLQSASPGSTNVALAP